MLRNSVLDRPGFKSPTNFAVLIPIIIALLAGWALSFFLFRDDYYFLIPLSVVFFLLCIYVGNHVVFLNYQIIYLSEDGLELSYPDGFCITKSKYVSLKLPYNAIVNVEYVGGINGELIVRTQDVEYKFYHLPNGAKIVGILKEHIFGEQASGEDGVGVTSINYETSDVPKEKVESSIKRLMLLFFSILLLLALFTQL